LAAKDQNELFSSIKTSKVSEEVYKQLISLIGRGRLKPGDRLPPERELAAKLGVSRQSVREALYKAEVLGLVSVRQGEGSFILSSVGRALQSSLGAILEAESGVVFDFLEMRQVIEGWCAERAALQAEAEDLAAMEDILGRMRRTGLTDSAWEKLDVEFHLAVAAASHNLVAFHLMEVLKDNFDVFFQFRQRLKERPDSSELMWQHHDDIYQAIKAGQPQLARERLVYHLDYIAAGLRTNLQKVGA
jgi:GntR family transcriptional repressor for pyruvate dehydrogenase complex